MKLCFNNKKKLRIEFNQLLFYDLDIVLCTTFFPDCFLKCCDDMILLSRDTKNNAATSCTINKVKSIWF